MSTFMSTSNFKKIRKTCLKHTKEFNDYILQYIYMVIYWQPVQSIFSTQFELVVHTLKTEKFCKKIHIWVSP